MPPRDRIVSEAAARRAGAHVRTARTAHLAADRQGAEAAYRAALGEDPGDPEALHGLGCLHLERGDAATAVGLIGRALERDRTRAAFHVSIGGALLQLGHAEAARAALALATLHEPDDAFAHLLHARILVSLGRSAAADTAFDRAAACAPLDGVVRLERGAHRMAAGRLAAALDDFRAARAARPNDPAILSNLGAALRELGRIDEAAPVLDRAVELDPARGEALGNRGLNRLALGDLDAALDDLERAAILLPGSVAARRNLASGFYEADRRAEAAGLLATLPPDPATTLNRATIALAEGRWAEGWPGYEARLALHPPMAREAIPFWAGAPLAGGTLLVEAEQGVGDSLMFLRYVPLAAERAGVPVTLALPRGLHRLVGDLPGLAAVVEPDAIPTDLPAARVMLGSLPGFFSPHPGAVPPPPTLAVTRASARGDAAFRVGIAWSGNPLYKQDRRRSVAPALLGALLAVPEVAFVALQDGTPPDGVAPPPEPLRDWAATASLVSSVDLVITVDTAVAHLAGSLGAPTWLLDRAGGDWRWLRDGAVQPWYPSVRLFRQARAAPPAEAWPPVIAEVTDALRQAIATLRRGGGVSSGEASTSISASRSWSSLRSLLIFSPNTSRT